MRLEIDHTQSIAPPPIADIVANAPDRDYTESRDALNEGIKAAQAGNRQKARAALMRATELDRNNENAWLWLASISEYPEELMSFLENVLSINASNERANQWMSATKTLLAKTFVQRGTDATEADQPMYAEDCFRKALEYDESNAAAWLWLASLTTNAGERVEFLNRVLAIEPDNTAANNALTAIRAENEKARFAAIKESALAGDMPVTTNLLDAFNTEFPENADAWMLRSHLSALPAEKLAALNRVLEIDPANEAARLSLESLTSMFSEPANEEPVPVQVEDVGHVEAAADEVAVMQNVEILAVEEVVASNGSLVSDEAECQTLAGDDAPEESLAPPIDESVDEPTPVPEPKEELVFEPVQSDPFVSCPPTVDLSAEEFAAIMASDPEPPIAPPADWERETEAFDVAELIPDEVQASNIPGDIEAVEAFDKAFAIPMPNASLDEPAPIEPPRTGFETNVVSNLNGAHSNSSQCPFCSAANEASAFVCGSCSAVLTLSDLESLIANNNADKYVIRNAVEEMERKRALGEPDEASLTMLGIGHLNLRNLQYGYNYLLEASQLNPDNIMLSSQVNALLIRMEEIRRQDEVHASMTKGKTILVVDDSATVRKLIAGKLEKSGHQVFCSSDGVEALERLQDLLPDLVLLDITMPRMDGYQVCRQIRGHETTANIPVVMISGKDGFFDKVRGRMAGTTGYITKPFGPETLMKAVEFYLGGGKDLDDGDEPAEMIH